MYSLLTKDLAIQNLFIFTVAGFVPCDGHKRLPVDHHSADYIFWSFWIIDFILGYFENRVMPKPVTSVAYFNVIH